MNIRLLLDHRGVVSAAGGGAVSDVNARVDAVFARFTAETRGARSIVCGVDRVLDSTGSSNRRAR
jgi:hypothetical protein